MVRRSSAAPRVTCGLCGGLLRDASATTVPECLHSFCRSCIYEKFADEEDSCCPTYSIDLGRTPLDKLRADHSLQSVRENLFPSKRQKIEEVPSLHPASVFLLPLGVHGGNHPAKNAPADLLGEPVNNDKQGKNKDFQASRLLLVSNVAPEAEIVQLQEDIEPLWSSLENARRQAEDAGLVCGEQMRLKLHEAVAEARKERDAARKKAEEAEAACALLRTQANKMLEAAWKQVANAVNSSKEAEKRVAHAEQCQAEAETKIVQLLQKVERLLSSLEKAKRPAEDAGLARGEQMRLQLQEALAEACKEKGSATKKVAVAKATCALLRVQENQVLEATQKWTADVSNAKLRQRRSLRTLNVTAAPIKI